MNTTTASASPSIPSRNALIESHLPLVRSLAARVHRQLQYNVERDELVSLGLEGLVEAAERFDPTNGASFRTFAAYRVRGAMVDGVGRLAPNSRKTYKRLKNLRDACQPTAMPTAEAWSDPEADPTPRPADHELHKKRMSDLLEDAITELPEDRQRLIRACYFENETLLDAGKDLGISKSWASRIHKSCLESLRRSLEARGAYDA